MARNIGDTKQVPFDVCSVNGEQGMDNPVTIAHSKRLGTTIRVSAKEQHLRQLKRREAIMRHSMHTTKAQLRRNDSDLPTAVRPYDFRRTCIVRLCWLNV